jgi:uncharacterized protein
MPEYLAPGVYVEEVPSGNKPIEGVSTSTAGMVGVTQRGPVNVPTLVTSFGEFNRRFGGYLDHRVFQNDTDVLPYAAEGFFTNGGQRLYITRVLGGAASHATLDLYGAPAADAASTTLGARADAGATLIVINDGTGISNGSVLLLRDGAYSEYVTAASPPVAAGIRLFAGLRSDRAAGTQVDVQDVTSETPNLTANISGNMAAGGTTLALNAAGLSGLSAGDVIRISQPGRPELTEFVTVAVDGEGGINQPLLFDHPQASAQVHVVTIADEGTSTTLAGNLTAGETMIPLANASGFAASQVVVIGTGAGREIQLVRNQFSSLSIATTQPTRFIHEAGVQVAEQVPLLRVHARYPGIWGNALRVTVRPSSILETAAAQNRAQNAPTLELDAVFGLTPGSVLEITSGGVTNRQRVQGVNLPANQVSFDGGLQSAVTEGDAIRSVEFDLIIDRLNADGKVVEAEAFQNLALDPAHPRYAPNIVGVFNTSTGRPEEAGEAELVRLSDQAGGITGARLSRPESAAAGLMTGGDDDLAAINDQTYIGQDADDPDARTGLHSLKNIDDISIVAVPGRTSIDAQNAIINHCAAMRYRFGVLDSQRSARMSAVQRQRQNYDTTFAALYYPWTVIGDPFGRQGEVRYVPPSGYVVGVYARADVQRGVHKAPANEVVLGIRDLEFRLTKGEQDILNPKHINCLRDFRDLNRAIRVWGARTLSSDPEWKYINVRRLFLFVEKSIERGTQWAVFEPNAEPLWATIRRSLTDFLTAVWRSGALEGTKPEEAFFVKCDRSTMTQNDIDNGRLIILVGIAPVKPAEFVIFRISQKTREATG